MGEIFWNDCVDIGLTRRIFLEHLNTFNLMWSIHDIFAHARPFTRFEKWQKPRLNSRTSCWNRVVVARYWDRTLTIRSPKPQERLSRLDGNGTQGATEKFRFPLGHNRYVMSFSKAGCHLHIKFLTNVGTQNAVPGQSILSSWDSEYEKENWELRSESDVMTSESSLWTVRSSLREGQAIEILADWRAGWELFS